MKRLVALIKQKSGFTLLELIIFSAIFSLISVVFVAMLVSITGVQLKQTASSEVNRQSQFVLQTIQRYVEGSSLVETEATSTPLHSILLRMPTGSNGTSSLINIYWESSTDPGDTYSTIYLKTGSGAPEALTSSRVKVEDLTFTKYSRPNAHDSVSFVMALSYDGSTSTAKKFFQRLATTATRVSAATFDTDLVPHPSAADLSIGVAAYKWESVNDILHFPDGTNDVYFTGYVGIGDVPSYPLHVQGDSLVTGNNTTQGVLIADNELWLKSGGFQSNGCQSDSDVGKMRIMTGATDELQVCLDGQWRAVSTTLPNN